MWVEELKREETTQEVSFSSQSETKDSLDSGEETPTWLPAILLPLAAMCLGQDLWPRKSGFTLVPWRENMCLMGVRWALTRIQWGDGVRTSENVVRPGHKGWNATGQISGCIDCCGGSRKIEGLHLYQQEGQWHCGVTSTCTVPAHTCSCTVLAHTCTCSVLAHT